MESELIKGGLDMKPTEELTEEHKKIKAMLKVLQGVAGRLDAGDKVEVADLENIVDFIRGFADRYHHAKEEDLLFPAMEEAGIPRQGGPTAVMLIEHDMGRKYVKAMAEAIPEFQAGNGKGAKKFAQNARDFAALLSQHIDKEDNILYLMADASIPEEKQEELKEQFAKANARELSVEKRLDYEKLVGRLAEIYAGA
jgi:hemerythrin-like domain-containing protein